MTVGVLVEQDSETLLRFHIASVPAFHIADARIKVARLACCSDVKMPKGETRNGSVAVAKTSLMLFGDAFLRIKLAKDVNDCARLL